MPGQHYTGHVWQPSDLHLDPAVDDGSIPFYHNVVGTPFCATGVISDRTQSQRRAADLCQTIKCEARNMPVAVQVKLRLIDRDRRPKVFQSEVANELAGAEESGPGP